MTPPSFERLDYLLRANKNMERKIVFDLLLHGQKLLGIDSPLYVGLGSIWFADFRLAHRTLGLRRMISIEKESYAARADFNKPYESIAVLPGECLPVMRGFASAEWQNPQFAWLDFDGALNEDVASVTKLFLSKCAENSVLVVTINAMRKRYAKNRINKKREDTAIGYIEHVLGGGATAPRFEPRVTGGKQFEDVDDIKFHEALADSLLAFLVHQTNVLARQSNRKSLKFVPLLNLCHEDGAPMVTVGGSVCTDHDSVTWQKCLVDHPVLSQTNGYPNFQRLDLIPITLKEKLTLDGCLPKDEVEFLRQATEIGIKLSKEQIEKYRLFNRHFPVFVESPI
jgi:Putative O-methyltransferase